jgi:drug/metabolite transporter (DMT)-like permease
VAPRYLVMLLALGAIWGASYLFIEIALRDLEPAALIEGRFLFGLAFLVPAVALAAGRGAALAGLRAAPWRLALVALGNAVAPFLLIAWGQQSIDSGLAGILLASSPLFTALVASAYHREERATGLRLAGVLVGFVGVALLLGVQPASGDDALLGAVAVVCAALLYSVSGLYIGRRLADIPPLAVAVGTTLWATFLTLPLALVVWPDEVPGLGPAAAVVVLGVGGTGVAYVLYFALIGGAGASRAILVNYLIPTMAVAYGVTLLDEPLTASMVGGLALILAGVTLGTGLVGSRR